MDVEKIFYEFSPPIFRWAEIGFDQPQPQPLQSPSQQSQLVTNKSFMVRSFHMEICL
jgi:hypothetical protein